MDLSFKYYKSEIFNIEPWHDTIKRNIDRLNNLEQKSKKLIEESKRKYIGYEPVTLTSGGKDSSVVDYLVGERVIFNNTSLDCADTYKHIKEHKNCTIINPDKGFYQWRKESNFVPTRFGRACCTIFKEGAMIEKLDANKKYLFFMGMRNEESNTRADYGDEWRNDKWGKRAWQGVLPIREWTELDVWLFILWKNLSINSKYRKGYARVGCAIACPFYAKSTWVLDKYWYPSMYKRWHDILDEDFTTNNKDIIMNCTQEEYHKCWNGGVYREIPTEGVISQYAERNGLDKQIAEKYFNHSCKDCGKKVKSKEVLAMNMKYFGRQTNQFYCKKHLMEQLNMTKQEWGDKVQEFKEQGCQLF